VVHGTVVHNRTEVDAMPRLDNALGGGGVPTLIHIHYLHLGFAVALAGIVQHAAMIFRRRSMAAFLSHGIGAETTVHTLTTNALCVFLCAEISGLADLYQVVVTCAAHGLAFVLATAVLLHMHGVGSTLCALSGPVDPVGATAGVDAEAGAGAGAGAGVAVSKEDKVVVGRRLRWFGVCPVRMGHSHPPVHTIVLAQTTRVVAMLLCLFPWAWVMPHYVAGVQAGHRPDVTILLLPPLLLAFSLVKLAWIPGVAWARTPSNTRRVYFTETLFDISQAFVILFCAMVDVLVPAAGLVHGLVDGDAGA
jgi:hypothetical protein